MGTLLQILIIWFAVSIIVSLILGRVLASTSRTLEMTPEDGTSDVQMGNHMRRMKHNEQETVVS